MGLNDYDNKARPAKPLEQEKIKKSNMKKSYCFLVILILFLNQSFVNGTPRKEVNAVVEAIPNYIFHLFTLGGIVADDSEYIAMYGESISKEDRDYLFEHKNLLAWADGNTAPLIHFFLFIPANFTSQNEFNEYFDFLDNTLKNNECKAFVQKYDSYLKKVNWMSDSVDMAEMELYLQSIIQYTHEVEEIGKIFKNNFQTYYSNIWKTEKEKLEKTAQIINGKLQKHDFIAHWEKLTGLAFKTEKFEIVLFSSNKNGPSANSLSYDRDAFYYGLDTDDLLQFICHEVGTHILITSFVEIMQMNRFEFQDIYSAYENTAEFYTAKHVLKKEPIIGYDVEKYYQILDKIYNLNPDITPTNLMIKGIETYNAQKK